jgi:hypothetical protein
MSEFIMKEELSRPMNAVLRRRRINGFFAFLRVAGRLAVMALCVDAAGAQAPQPAASCDQTPAWSPCDLVFELSEKAAAEHPNPYATVELKGEFRSPNMRTLAIPGYWDGGRRMVLRFAPMAEGRWEYRLTSNVPELDGKAGAFTAAVSDAPGFIQPANVHHWSYSPRIQPHLWMGATELRYAFLDDAAFRAVADARASQKFNHLRGLVLGDVPMAPPDTPDLAHFRRLDERIRYLNQKGITADLVLAPGAGALQKLAGGAGAGFPGLRRLVRFVVGRYAAMNITWQGADAFEGDPGARATLRSLGGLLKEMDGYRHPRTTGARVTSAPALDDGWMDFNSYGTADQAVGAIEHQLYQVPAVNQFAREDSGAGKSAPGDEDAAAFRHDLWNTTMNGQYPVYANTGSGSRFVDSPGAKAMRVWFDFMSTTRHWDLEPYFDVDGGRALALPDVEYIVYVDKAGPIELSVEKHGYDVIWLDPADGTVTRRKFSGDHFTGEPPDRYHDWVLHVVRESTLAGMNRSYKFESRDVPVQEIVISPEKVPFEIEQPIGDLAMGKPLAFGAKLKRATRATRTMLWLWTGEVTADKQGYRVLATGQQGTFTPPPGLAVDYPAIMLLRLYGMNGYGTVYMLSKGYALNQ